MAQTRYPGIYSFSQAQSDIFFGREQDSESLKTLIETEQQILLYSKSGLGKSSLINAGLLPRLPDTYRFVEIRFKAYRDENSPSPVAKAREETLRQLPELINAPENPADRLITDEKDRQSLWFLFKKLQCISEEKNYLLIFDQFEELFTYPEVQIKEFKNQLYQLMRVSLPGKFQKLLADLRRNKSGSISRAEAGALQKALSVKSLFAIRSDKLSLLNQLSDKLPDIQSHFYELLPLTHEQTRQAITAPAARKGDYKYPPFSYDEEALEKIMRFLTSNYERQAESTQLQIICRRIEEKNSAGKRIELSDVPDFKNIFLDFYHSATAKLKPEEQTKARRLIEDEMIRNGQRISLDGRICTEYISPESLKTLTDNYLIRAEKNSTGDYSYELSHDSLVNPILEAAEKRRQKEAEEKRLRQKNEELALAKKKQKRQRRIIILISLAALVAFFLAVFAWLSGADAKFMEKRAHTAIFDFAVKNKIQHWRGFQEHEKIGNTQALLSQIDSLDLSHNDLWGIPAELAECPNLRYLNLLGNSRIHWDIDRTTEVLDALNPETELYISNSDIILIAERHRKLIAGLQIIPDEKTSIPDRILELKQLKYFDISGRESKQNYFDEIPLELFDLKNLEFLKMKYCNLEHFPDDVGRLQKLQVLNLDYNKLSELPENLAKLERLKKLFLGYNELSALPNSYGELENLQQLYITGNKFADIPEAVSKMKNLRVFAAGRNQIQNVDELKHLNKLEIVYLWENPVTDLPLEMAAFPNLRELNLHKTNLDNAAFVRFLQACPKVVELTKNADKKYNSNPAVLRIYVGKIAPEWAALPNVSVVE
jgi:Leucine-rich repeat (LRR) protein